MRLGEAPLVRLPHHAELESEHRLEGVLAVGVAAEELALPLGGGGRALGGGVLIVVAIALAIAIAIAIENANGKGSATM